MALCTGHLSYARPLTVPLPANRDYAGRPRTCPSQPCNPDTPSRSGQDSTRQRNSQRKCSRMSFFECSFLGSYAELR